MSQRVIFIEPAGAPSNVFAKFMTIPLLGPIYLGSLARDAGYDVEILNENILGRHVEEADLLNADILCLSCITATVQRGKEIAVQYRHLRDKTGQDSRVLFGGIHASMMPEDVADVADQIVVREAEEVFLDVLSGKITDKIVNGTAVKDMDKLPVPDFSLIRNNEAVKTMPIMTSRGCPYDCNFCSVTEMFGRGYRTHCAERVLDEIMKVKSGHIFFTDDHFAANPKRTDRLLDMMMAEGFNRPWSAQVRTEITKRPKLLDKMHKAGCHTVYVGFESINPETLVDMHKGQTVDDIKRSISVLHGHGIAVHGMFMFGSDTDTPDVFPRTTEFCHNARLDYAQYCILTPLPGTEVYRNFESEGRLLHKNWQYYDALHTVFRPKNMTPAQLQQGMIDCFSDFYTYTNAFNDALNAVVDAFGNTISSLFRRIHLPVFRPSFMKAFGRGVVNKWVEQNQDYLAYLENA